MSFLKIIHEARLVARSDGRCKLTRKLGVGSGDARDTTVVESIHNPSKIPGQIP